MDLSVPFKPNPLLSTSNPLTKTVRYPKLPTHKPRISRQRPIFRVYSSANPDGSDGFSWPSIVRSIRVGSERFWSNFGQSVKRETGFDFEGANVKVGELVGRVKNEVKKGEAEFIRFRTVLVPEFVDWNRWERWKVIMWILIATLLANFLFGC